LAARFFGGGGRNKSFGQAFSILLQGCRPKRDKFKNSLSRCGLDDKPARSRYQQPDFAFFFTFFSCPDENFSIKNDRRTAEFGLL
jgi:hypothetical protein